MPASFDQEDEAAWRQRSQGPISIALESDSGGAVSQGMRLAMEEPKKPFEQVIGGRVPAGEGGGSVSRALTAEELASKIRHRIVSNPKSYEPIEAITPEIRQSLAETQARGEIRHEEIMKKLPPNPTSDDLFRAIMGREPPSRRK